MSPLTPRRYVTHGTGEYRREDFRRIGDIYVGHYASPIGEAPVEIEDDCDIGVGDGMQTGDSQSWPNLNHT